MPGPPAARLRSPRVHDSHNPRLEEALILLTRRPVTLPRSADHQERRHRGITTTTTNAITAPTRRTRTMHRPDAHRRDPAHHHARRGKSMRRRYEERSPRTAPDQAQPRPAIVSAAIAQADSPLTAMAHRARRERVTSASVQRSAAQRTTRSAAKSVAEMTADTKTTRPRLHAS